MAQISVISPGAFASVKVELERGERFLSESGAMVRMSANMDTDVTARPKGKGGLLGGLKRLMGGDSYFMSTYRPRGDAGEVVLAPTMPGDIEVLDLDGDATWMCAGGSYLASGPDVDLESRFEGMKGLFSGESMFYLEASGEGPLIVGAFGGIRELVCDGSLIVDTGHVVAFENTLDYTITKAGSSWISSFLAGEGFVMRFAGRGTILVQSHNPSEFGSAIGSLLPPRG